LAHVRIVLVELKGILHDVIRGVVEEQGDMRIVADLETGDHLLDTIATTDPDFVIWGGEGEVLDLYADLLENRMPVKVLAVENGGRRGVVWELRAAYLDELSPSRLLDALRAVQHA
jgi:chemotaxis response regulator CheB